MRRELEGVSIGGVVGGAQGGGRGLLFKFVDCVCVAGFDKGAIGAFTWVGGWAGQLLASVQVVVIAWAVGSRGVLLEESEVVKSVCVDSCFNLMSVVCFLLGIEIS